MKNSDNTNGEEFIVYTFSPKIKKKQKEQLEDLKGKLINNNNLQFDLTDILNVISAGSKEDVEQIYNKIGAPNESESFRDIESPNYDKQKALVFDLADRLKTKSQKHSESVQKDLGKGINLPPQQPKSSWKLDSKVGVKYNKGKLPLDVMITKQFPKALKAICEATMFGHQEYLEHDSDYLNFKKVEGGSQTYADALQRHNLNKNEKDEKSGLPHIYHKAWNALAELELWIEEDEKLNYKKNE